MAKTGDLLNLQDVLDIVAIPPSDGALAARYRESAARAVQFLRGADPLDIPKLSSMTLRGRAFAVFTNVASLVLRAKQVGLSPPENVFVSLPKLNILREVFRPPQISPDEVSRLVTTMTALLDLLAAEASGALDISARAVSPAQISSYTFSVDGYKKKTLGGVVTLLPNVEEIKRARALEALARLDFSLRLPRIVFVSEHPAGGAVVGWRRMADAASFVVRRKNMFENAVVETAFTAEQVQGQTAALSGFFASWIAPFYDDLDVRSIQMVRDVSVAPDLIYSFKVQARQAAAIAVDSPLAGPTRPVALSSGQLASVRAAITAQIKSSGLPLSADDVSPYPAISEAIFGDQRYDWVVAATNVRASAARGDDVTVVRRFSFLGATISFVEASIRAGTFVVPADLGAVALAIEKSVAASGISATIFDVLDKSGLLFFFGEKEDLGRTDSAAAGTLGAVLSSIDLTTATFDPQVLASNLTTTTASPARSESVPALDLQVSSGAASHKTSVASELVDLTTFDGIGKLMDVIRAYFDFAKGRRSDA